MKLKFTNKQILELAVENIFHKGFVIRDSDVGDNVWEFEGNRTASKSFGKDPYICQHEWPLDCGVQCGGDGIVLEAGSPSLEETLTDVDSAMKVITGKVPCRRTAFFEAFPRSPDTFIRGEGTTIEEAEKECWESYQKKLTCPNHEFERRGRDDGYCFCKHCNLSGMFMQPLNPCAGCGVVEYALWSHDKNKAGYCRKCYEKLPDEMLNETSLKLKKWNT